MGDPGGEGRDAEEIDEVEEEGPEQGSDPGSPVNGKKNSNSCLGKAQQVLDGMKRKVYSLLRRAGINLIRWSV